MSANRKPRLPLPTRRVTILRPGIAPPPSALCPLPPALLPILLGSYILGCFVAAYYVARFRRGVDIRQSGSGNAGARNMARVYGPFDAVLTFGLDTAKGAVAVLAGFYFVGPEWAGVAALCAAIVGHIWPAQLSFHGGKGAATGLGGIVVIDPLATLALLGCGAVAFAITRNFTRSGLTSIALAAPMLAVFKHDLPTLAVTAVTSALCLVVHHPVLDAPRQPRGISGPAPPDDRAATRD